VASKKSSTDTTDTTDNSAAEGSPGAAKTKRGITARGAPKPAGTPKPAGAPKPARTPKAAGASKPAGAPKPARTPKRPVAAKAAQAGAKAAALKAVVIDALGDMKALQIKVLDVRGLTDVADTMVIASGTSDRHVRSVAQNVVEKAKAAGFRPHGVEGQQDSDWVLIDLNEMIVHVMLPRVREFYGLEKLWDMSLAKRVAGV
jgi:ribosome silencing factor RsfS/YbeB/iojap